MYWVGCGVSACIGLGVECLHVLGWVWSVCMYWVGCGVSACIGLGVECLHVLGSVWSVCMLSIT